MTISRLGEVPGRGAIAPCQARIDSPSTLSGLPQIGEYQVKNGDRVLVQGQLDTRDNGVYTASYSRWERADDFDGNSEVFPGILAPVINPGASTIFVYAVSSDASPVRVGIDPVDFVNAVSPIGPVEIPDNSIGTDELDQAVIDLLDQLGLNINTLSQDIQDVSDDIQQEINDRNQAITDAIGPLQSGLNTAQQAATAAGNSAASANSAASGAVARINDTSGDGSNRTLEALAASELLTSSQVQAQGAELTAQSDRITAAESKFTDVLGDGSNLELSTFASTTEATRAEINDPTTGLSATRNLAVSTDTRLDQLGGGGTARSVEDLNVAFDQLEQNVATGVGGAATVESVNQVDLRVNGVEDRLNDTGGGLSIESVASSLQTTSTTATNALGQANSAISDAAAARSIADTNTNDLSALSLRTGTVEAQLNDSGGLTARVTQTESAIASFNTVNALWQVQTDVNNLSGQIGLVNDGGTVKAFLKADEFFITGSSGEQLLFEAEAGQLYPSTGFSLYRSLETLTPGTIQLSGKDFTRSYRKDTSGAVTINLAADNDQLNTVFTVDNSIGTIGAINSGNITLNAAVTNGLIVGGYRNVPTVTITPGSKFSFAHRGGNVYEAIREEVNFYDAVEGTPSTIVPADQTRIRIASTETVVAQGLHHVRAVIRHNRANSATPAALEFQYGFDGSSGIAYLGATNYLPIGQTGPQGVTEAGQITFDGSGQIDQPEFTSGASNPSVTVIEGTLFSSGGVFFLSARKTNAVAEDTFISGQSYVDIKLIKPI